MDAYIAEAEIRKSRFWKVAKRACFAAPFLLGTLVYYILWRKDNFALSSEKFTFSLSTCAVALILAGTYYFAYKFFKENFYFFVGISWLANAIYLIPDLNPPPLCDATFSTHKLFVYGLSLTATLFQGLSLFTRAQADSDLPTWKLIPRGTLKAIAVVAVVYAGLSSAYIYGLPAAGFPPMPKREVVIHSEQIKSRVDEKTCDKSRIYPDNEHITMAKVMVPGAILFFIVLCAVGASLRARVRFENPGRKGLILAYTFYVYAVLQLLYPYTFYPLNDWLLPMFLFAQLAKVGNALALMGVLQSVSSLRESRRDAEAQYTQNLMAIKEAQLEAQAAKLRVQDAELERQRTVVELGLLAASIKHDVNTPLATMAMDVGTLINRFQHDSRIVTKLKSLQDSMERIYAIVKVVDIFRGDKAFFDRDEFMKKASLLEVVHRAVRSVKNEREELKQGNARTFIKVEGREVWVRAYAPMLEQVVVNVIKNGLEAIEEVERQRGIIRVVVGTAEIEGGKYQRWARVEIEDNGCGIPPEHMDKLTTIFTTRGAKKPNSGIGLFIGRKILDIHDGKIQFESTVGEGTKVTLLLPEWNAIQRAEQQVTAAEPPTADAPPDEAPEAPGGPAGAASAGQMTHPALAGKPVNPGGTE